MTRRQGILAVLAAIVGTMSGRLRAEGLINSTTTQSITLLPMSVTFPLDSYRDFTFICGKDSVTMTPAEIMAALKQ